MAGQHHNVKNARDLPPPDASRGWKPLEFDEFRTRITQGQKDIRTPVISNQLPQVPITTYAGAQLRQFQCLLTRNYNVSFAAGTFKEFQPQAVQLATNKVGTGLGIGTLKNLDVNAKSKATGLLAKATAYGRVSARIPPS